MKKYVAGLLTGVLITMSISVFGEDIVKQAILTTEIKLKVNGTDTPAEFVNVDGTNYAKVRDIVSAVGGVTAWDQETKTILVNTTTDIPIVTEPVPESTPEPAPTPIPKEEVTLTPVEIDGEEYIEWSNLNSYCLSKKYAVLRFPTLMTVTINTIKGVTSQSPYLAKIQLYKFNDNYYVKYSDFLNTFSPIIE
jgi:hypothetical protein